MQKGAESELRFVMANDQPMRGPQTLAWEVNSVLFDGAKLCVVPEPTARAPLAAVGGMGCLFALGRR